jgi:hypothetical protein
MLVVFESVYTVIKKIHISFRVVSQYGAPTVQIWRRPQYRAVVSLSDHWFSPAGPVTPCPISI